jgi:CRISPR system Cascade subunit CasC
MFVELHMIQNFGPSCLNRDDTNTPKDCNFGGYRRSRLSSQCQKRAIRDLFNEQLSAKNEIIGVRSRLLPTKIKEILLKEGKNEDEILSVLKVVLKEISFETNKEGNQTKVLLFFNNDLPKKLAQIFIDNWDTLSKEKINKKDLKVFTPLMNEIKTDLSADIALFGRMVASNTDLKVDAACYMAHALSTHNIAMEMDFFTAIDDLQESSESGAGMMGNIMYNSPCYYRYSVIDIDQLKSNLKGDKNDTILAMKAYLQCAIKAIPTGKQTSMAAFNQPSLILAVIKNDQPWTLSNAFAKPVWIGSKKTSLISESIQKMDLHLKQLVEFYDIAENLSLYWALLDDSKKPAFISQIGNECTTFNELIENIGDKLDASDLASV